MKKVSVYKVERKFIEKLIALVNRSTNPVMDIFKADKNVKMRVVIDYNPQMSKVKIVYHMEDMH